MLGDVEYRFGELRFEMRADTSDWNTVSACTTHDEYDLRKLDLRGKRFFDVGSHIGGVTVLAASLGASVVSFEPVGPNARLTQRNLEINGLKGEMCQRPAGDGSPMIVRWDFEYDENARHHRFIGNTSHVEDVAPTDAEHSELLLDSITYFEAEALYGRPDIVKIDCEGGEWDWVGVMSFVPLIIGEWHANRGSRDEFHALLEPTHDVQYTGPVGGPGGFVARMR